MSITPDQNKLFNTKPIIKPRKEVLYRMKLIIRELDKEAIKASVDTINHMIESLSFKPIQVRIYDPGFIIIYWSIPVKSSFTFSVDVFMFAEKYMPDWNNKELSLLQFSEGVLNDDKFMTPEYFRVLKKYLRIENIVWFNKEFKDIYNTRI